MMGAGLVRVQACEAEGAGQNFCKFCHRAPPETSDVAAVKDYKQGEAH